MQRSGPQFAINKEGQPLLPPRIKTPNPQPQGSGVVERMKRARHSAERALIALDARAYEFISPRTLRRVLRLA